MQVTCNKGNLTEIPIRELAPFVVKLSLSRSNISRIPRGTFAKLKDLEELNLDDNNISRIERFAFEGLGKLHRLSIRRTSLRRLEKFSFSGLQNMTCILLDNNRIETIEGSAFAGSSNIQIIFLHNNPIHVIQSHAFANLRHVEYLILPVGVKSIQPDAFNGLDSVGLIKLPLMDLESMESFTFRGLSQVLRLEIRESDLGVVQPRVFEGMVNVTSLVFVKNKIDYLKELRIKAENKIKILKLEGNHILQIPIPGSVDIQVLENYTVIDNHFPCDCRLHSLMVSPLTNGTSSNFSAENFCISPLNVNGKSISDVKLEDVEPCSNEYSLDSWNIGAAIRQRAISQYTCIFMLVTIRYC